MDCGYTAFTLLVDKTQYEFDKGVISKYEEIMELSNEYEVDAAYSVIEVEIFMSGRTAEELCRFILSTLDFIALHQEDSTYIISKTGDILKKTLPEIYPKIDRIYFIYDMLTSGERYECLSVLKDIDSEDRLIHEEKGAIYSLLLSRDTRFLFTEEPIITIEDGITGIKQDIDLTEGLDLFKFHIGIIQLKS